MDSGLLLLLATLILDLAPVDIPKQNVCLPLAQNVEVLLVGLKWTGLPRLADTSRDVASSSMKIAPSTQAYQTFLGY
jgi:hypothetical protein